MPDPQMSSTEFAAKIKAKYPDYANIPDTELVAKMITKYPEYRDKVSFGAPQQNYSSMSPQDLSAQAMRNSGVTGTQRLAATAPKVNMQESPTAIGNIANSAVDQAKGGGRFLKAAAQDAVGQVTGSMGLAKDVLAEGGSSPEAMSMALSRHMVQPIVESSQDRSQSKAETLGLMAGVNSPAMKESALKGDYASILGHSVMPLVTAMVAGRAANEVAPKLPSRAHASELFSEVGNAIGDNPIPAGGAAGDAALKIQEMSKRGLTMPKVVSDFVKRMTDPAGGPLSYEEARDFASNASNLTWKETSSMRPKMKAAVGDFAQKVNEHIATAADEAGKKAEYLEAMGEYKTASQWRSRATSLRKVLEKTAKVAVPAAGAGFVAQQVWNGK